MVFHREPWRVATRWPGSQEVGGSIPVIVITYFKRAATLSDPS